MTPITVLIMFSVSPDITTDWFSSVLTQTVVYGGPAVGSLYLIVRIVLGTQDKALQNMTKRLGDNENRNATLEARIVTLEDAGADAAGVEMELNREINRLQIALDRRDATIERLEQELTTTRAVLRGMTGGRLTDEQVEQLLPKDDPPTEGEH